MDQKGVSGKAQFNHPCGIAVTSNGTILVADTGNCRIQELTMEGEFVGENVHFKHPKGISINKTTGQVFVANDMKHQVKVLNPDLTFRYTFGRKGSGQGQFDRPWNVAFDSKGFVYVTDYRIQKFTPNGRFVDMFGTERYIPSHLNHPSGITVDDNDLLYVTERDNNRVSIFTADGEFLHCFGEEGQINMPKGISFDKNGLLYVCDYNNSRVVVY